MTEREMLIKETARRIEKRVIPIDGCWYWPGSKTPKGYGQISCAQLGGKNYTHRIMYEAHNGPIPENMQIDHLCSNTSCCALWHLEAVTASVNTQRSYERNRSFTARPRKEKACKDCENG